MVINVNKLVFLRHSGRKIIFWDISISFYLQGIQEAKSHASEDAFKEGKGVQGGKRHLRWERHSRREEAFWEGNYKKVHRQKDMNCSLILDFAD